MSNDTFEQFMIQALHLACSKPRHDPEKCVLTLAVTFGFDLGQIQTLDNYFVLPRKQTLKNLQKWYHLSSKTVARLEKQCTVSRTADDSLDVAVIMLAHASRKIFVHQLVIPLVNISRNIPHPRTCDTKAIALFEQLKQKPKPDFESPELNDT